MRRLLPIVLSTAFALACASPPPVTAADTRGERPKLRAQTAGSSSAVRRAAAHDLRHQIVRSAEAMIGTPYRYGGSDPARGFDCSGLVLYSYGRAGVDGLPRTARALEDEAKGIRLSELRPADLLFFDLDSKAQHVAIYAGNREFIHAPSPGKRVERVSFDHAYWGAKLERAGRLLP